VNIHATPEWGYETGSRRGERDGRVGKLHRRGCELDLGIILSVNWRRGGDRQDRFNQPVNARYSATVGDVALTVSVHLAGGNPFEFGFGPPQPKRTADYTWAWGSLGYFGFADKDARREVHRKAKEWLKANPGR